MNLAVPRGDGGLAGPELTAAGGRYSPRDLLDNTLHPSKVINEQYAMTAYSLQHGRQIVGRIVNLSGDLIILATDPVDPDGSEVRFKREDVESMTTVPTSLMPDGLLNTFTSDDVLDLLAYLTQPPPPGSHHDVGGWMVVPGRSRTVHADVQFSQPAWYHGGSRMHAALRFLRITSPMATLVTNLRLSQTERDGIRRAVARACDELGVVWRRIVLFGSRVDPARRGGDIDLLIELDPRRPGDVYRLTQRLRLALEDEIGAQHFDLVVDDAGTTYGFPALAREQGVELWSNS